MNIINTKKIIAREVDFMIIDLIAVGGFKNIGLTKLDFTGITALVAPNGFGKSNVLNAIDFGVDFINSSPRTRNSMMHYAPNIPINKHTDKHDYSLKLVMRSTLKKRHCVVEYDLSFAWANDAGTGARITGENLEIRYMEKNSKPIKLISRTASKALYRSSETGRCNKGIKVNDDELVINQLSLHNTLFYRTIAKEIGELSFYIENRLDVAGNFEPSPIVSNFFSIESLDINNMDDAPRYIYFLRNKHPEKYEMLVHSFKSLFPDIVTLELAERDAFDDSKLREAMNNVPEDAPFTISNKIYNIFVFDKNLNQPIPFSYLSAGTKKIFVFLAIAISAEINKVSLIALEELENSIHPALMQQLITILEQVVGESRILLTSHSPYLVDYIEPQEIYLPLPKGDGVARFGNIKGERASKRFINDATKYEQSLGDYIFTLLSGDEDDFETLRSYMGVEQ